GGPKAEAGGGGGLARTRLFSTTRLPLVAALLSSSLALMLASAAWTPARAEVLALTGGTVHPVSAPEIPNGTVLVDGAKITAVGAGVSVPSGAKVIDCARKHV